MKKEQTSWGTVALWYNDLLETSADSYQAQVVLPNLLRLADPKGGKTMLDLACGQGYFSRAFQEKGASVTGVDISPELIAIARKNSPKEINYYVSAGDRVSVALQSGKGGTPSFDVITCILALQNIENMAGVFSECSKLLKPDGRFIFVINHPAFRIPKHSDWHYDTKEEKMTRIVDRYMSDEQIDIDMTPGEKNIARKKFTVSFHRPLQSYAKALEKNGFAISRLEEWISHKKSEEGPRSKEADRMRKEIPMFLAVVCALGR